MKKENVKIKSVSLNDNYEKYITIRNVRVNNRNYTSPILLVYDGFGMGTCRINISNCRDNIISSRNQSLALENFLDINGNSNIKINNSYALNNVNIDLGCGCKKHNNFIGLDINILNDVDIVIDLDKNPIPFSDNSVINLVADNFLEHIFHLDFLMNEINRVCRNGANIEIVVPHFKSIPCEEHIREFRSSSLNNYEIKNINKGYKKFLICKSRKLIFKNRLLNLLFSNHPYFFERFYPFRVNCQLKILFEVKKC